MVEVNVGDIVRVDADPTRYKVLEVGETCTLTQAGAQPRIDFAGVAADRLTVVVRL